MTQVEEERELDAKKAMWNLLDRLIGKKAYGTIEAFVQEGQVVRIEKKESFLPKDFCRLTAE
ncbi:MAG: DUF2292 domain-containing protein [Elusimicrobia bacterium]|nr:DUF2292 domain-containing protein [Elusimicrobiota bacterium]